MYRWKWAYDACKIVANINPHVTVIHYFNRCILAASYPPISEHEQPEDSKLLELGRSLHGLSFYSIGRFRYHTAQIPSLWGVGLRQYSLLSHNNKLLCLQSATEQPVSGTVVMKLLGGYKPLAGHYSRVNLLLMNSYCSKLWDTLCGQVLQISRDLLDKSNSNFCSHKYSFNSCKFLLNPITSLYFLPLPARSL